MCEVVLIRWWWCGFGQGDRGDYYWWWFLCVIIGSISICICVWLDLWLAGCFVKCRMALFVRYSILYPVTIAYIVIVNNLRPTLTITTQSNVIIPNKLIPPLIINNPIILFQLLILLSLLKVIPISLRLFVTYLHHVTSLSINWSLLTPESIPMTTTKIPLL